MNEFEVTEQTLDFVREQINEDPDTGLILGSGLADLADVARNQVVIETESIPGYPRSTVQGHKGRLIFGTIEDRKVVFVQGRLHVYEGLSVRAATFPVRLLAELGVKSLILTNAAGGINPRFSPGTLMWITDHLNFSMGRSIQTDHTQGADTASRVRHGANPYDLEWTKRAAELAREMGVQTESGIYLWTLGPSYETKAEIRMFALLGADAVGMSTVPEAVEASARGMRVLGLSTITNLAAGLGDLSLNHDEVLEVGRQVQNDLQRLLRALIVKT